ncbi:hypothetical protein [Aquincola tertiaricarbonis]|uniref:hypothetical protein n=1 Tax=Aquincola tertiaricarbonis TaxID=391953 RepID=UPI000697699E|nr:hypothetical protein [Aquincola tertiaricarbonis]
MTRDKALPERLHVKGGRYYLVTAAGKKRVWRKLTRVAEGLPALYTALATALAGNTADDRMPALISLWQREVGSRHRPNTQANNDSRLRVLADAFSEFRAGQVEAPDVAEFLLPLRDKARTHNQYRALMRELMRSPSRKACDATTPCRT